MPAIADSDAFKDPGRVLPQHQAALTLLQGRLSAPSTKRLSWLDLACGRGQIIVSLDENLSPEARAKIEYSAYDLDHEFARETRKTAQRLGFASLETRLVTFRISIASYLKGCFLTSSLSLILSTRLSLFDWLVCLSAA
jgi:hypothetical protein